MPTWLLLAAFAGLPAALSRLYAVRTPETDHFRVLEPVQPGPDRLRLDLPAQCLLTLTTIAPE